MEVTDLYKPSDDTPGLRQQAAVLPTLEVGPDWL